MKNYYFRYLPHIFLFIFFYVHPRDIIQLSIPKTGTFLLQKCIRLLPGKQAGTLPGVQYPKHHYYIEPNKLKRILRRFFTNPNKFCSVHLMYDPIAAEIVQDNNYATFFIYRDPRDQIISYIFFTMDPSGPWPVAVGKPMDELISNLISVGTIANNNPPGKGIYDMYSRYLPWLEEPHICAIRFEELIGPQGGGSLELQIKAIKKIADHIGIEVTDEKIEFVTKNLFGGTYTFRKGHIGEWKKYFTEDHKKAFKEIAGQLLIDLGYENDFDW